MKGIYFHKSMLETALMLSNDDKNQMMQIMLAFMDGEDLPTNVESPMLKMWLESVRPLVNIQKDKKERMDDARRENGKKGGRPPKNKQTQKEAVLDPVTTPSESIVIAEEKVQQIEDKPTKMKLPKTTELLQYLKAHPKYKGLDNANKMLFEEAIVIDERITSEEDIDGVLNAIFQESTSSL